MKPTFTDISNVLDGHFDALSGRQRKKISVALNRLRCEVAFIINNRYLMRVNVRNDHAKIELVRQSMFDVVDALERIIKTSEGYALHTRVPEFCDLVSAETEKAVEAFRIILTFTDDALLDFVSGDGWELRFVRRHYHNLHTALQKTLDDI